MGQQVGALQRRGLTSGVQPEFKVNSFHSLTTETNTWHFVVLLPQLPLQCHFGRQLHWPSVWISWSMNPIEIHPRIPHWNFPEAEASSHMQSNWCALSYLGKSKYYKKKQNKNLRKPQKPKNLNHTWYTKDFKILMMQNFLDFFKCSPNCSQAKEPEEQLEAESLQLGSR